MSDEQPATISRSQLRDARVWAEHRQAILERRVQVVDDAPGWQVPAAGAVTVEGFMRDPNGSAVPGDGGAAS